MDGDSLSRVARAYVDAEKAYEKARVDLHRCRQEVLSRFHCDVYGRVEEAIVLTDCVILVTKSRESADIKVVARTHAPLGGPR